MITNPPLPAHLIFWASLLFYAAFLLVNISIQKTVTPEQVSLRERFANYSPIPGACLVSMLYFLGAEGLAFFTTPMVVVGYTCIWYGSLARLRHHA